MRCLGLALLNRNTDIARALAAAYELTAAAYSECGTALDRPIIWQLLTDTDTMFPPPAAVFKRHVEEAGEIYAMAHHEHDLLTYARVMELHDRSDMANSLRNAVRSQLLRDAQRPGHELVAPAPHLRSEPTYLRDNILLSAPIETIQTLAVSTNDADTAALCTKLKHNYFGAIERTVARSRHRNVCSLIAEVGFKPSDFPISPVDYAVIVSTKMNVVSDESNAIRCIKSEFERTSKISRTVEYFAGEPALAVMDVIAGIYRAAVSEDWRAFEALVGGKIEHAEPLLSKYGGPILWSALLRAPRNVFADFIKIFAQKWKLIRTYEVPDTKQTDCVDPWAAPSAFPFRLTAIRDAIEFADKMLLSPNCLLRIVDNLIALAGSGVMPVCHIFGHEWWTAERAKAFLDYLVIDKDEGMPLF